MTAHNIIDKIWDFHIVSQENGHPAVFAIDFMLLHEVTSAQAFQKLTEHGLKPFDPSRLLATIDHSIPTRADRWQITDPAAKTQIARLRQNAKKYGIPLFDLDSGHQGIVHVIGPELGLTQPGMTIVCGDSHTATHGAFGALAFGIGTSEVASVLATGCLLQTKPSSYQVHFEGSISKATFAKDIILRLIQEIGVAGATGYVIEYCGAAVSAMSMEERMTVCNMSIECGARAGLIGPDQTTLEYLQSRPFAPDSNRWDQAVQHWLSFRSDPNCSYDRCISINLENLKPMVTWGTNPGQSIAIDSHIPELQELPERDRRAAKEALDYVRLTPGQAISGVPIDWAFVGSCTNGRLEDLRITAKILEGRKVHPNVKFFIVPGSETVLREAEKEGLDQIFKAAGADFRLPGCSLCLGMNDDRVPPGKRCLSSSNRNFVGRQGPGSITHLASPATVAASAVNGQISCPSDFL